MDVTYSKSIYYNVRLTSRYIKAFISQILEQFNFGLSSPGVDPRAFYATHPFVFVIREIGSGIVFFSGVYAGGGQ